MSMEYPPIDDFVTPTKKSSTKKQLRSKIARLKEELETQGHKCDLRKDDRIQYMSIRNQVLSQECAELRVALA